MQFSYQWLRELVDGLDMPAHELGQLITVRTAECEGIHNVGELLAGARVARVIACEPVPGTKLQKTLVDVGGNARITVICGAPNCRVGLETVWAPVGRKTIQGIESDGMLASAQELGIGRGDEGVVELTDRWKALEPDQIIEIDNKSLTHRPDLWGHLGMAREVAAITRQPLLDPVDLRLLPSGSGSYDVRIEDFDLCPRFSAIVFENVSVRPSPWWLQYRLLAIGLNPINNIVDITNFVMAELAQPMHAFDRDKLHGDRLVVRCARAGETLAALNNEGYELSPQHGVVADAEGPVSVAGVIGGLPSAITEATTNVVFESANWKASRIRKTSTALKIRTDASMRFEKSQDPENTVRALARAIALMQMICPEARLVGGLTDVYQVLPQPQTIRLRQNVLNRKLGRDIPADEMTGILERLAFHVAGGPDEFTVTVPSWRATRDVSGPDDLVEEVGRMIGYDSIEPRAPLVACAVPPEEPGRVWLRELRALASARGFTEVFNYSFISDAQAARFGLPPQHQLRLLNPIASDQNLMRSSLIPGIHANLELNRKHFDEFRLFEIGREIHKRKDGLPDEVPHLVAAVFSASGDGVAGLFELKGLAQAIAPGCAVQPSDQPADQTRAYEHPARSASILLGGAIAGRLFEFHPAMIEGRAAVLDLDLNAVAAQLGKRAGYTPLRRFPSSAFDLSIFAPVRELAGSFEAKLREFAGPLMETVEYLREFQGGHVAEGLKSITFRVTLGAPDRTLSSDEVTAVRTRIIEAMRGFGYEMRV